MMMQVLNSGITVLLVNDIGSNNNIDSLTKNIKDKLPNIRHEIILVNCKNEVVKLKDPIENIDQVFYNEEGKSYIEIIEKAIKDAKYNWIFVLETDEVIEELDETSLIDLFEKENNAYYIDILNSNKIDSMDVTYNIEKVRLLNKKNIDLLSKYLDDSISNIKNIEKCDYIKVEKISYIYELDIEKRKLKKEKKFADINNKILSNPEDPYGYFLLGLAFKMDHNTEKAKESFMKALEYPINTEVAYVQLMIVLFGNILLEREEYEEALQLENLYDYFENLADFLCLMGKIYLKTGFIAEAIREFNKALNTLCCIEAGYNSVIPNYHLGCIYEVMGDIEIAKRLYERCGEYKPAKDRLEEMINKN